ncbi:MAG: hypothetical protein HGA65_08900 [Oscillochloris sp.]|nr:hypothetical protein [Oscillochloris sp.]
MHSARNPFSPDAFGLPSDPLTLLDMALTAAITVGGIGHVLITPLYYRHESGLNQAWFAGSGLALTFMGMLNIARLRGEATSEVFSKLANPAGALFLAVAASQNRAPQTIAASLLTTALAGLALRQ